MSKANITESPCLTTCFDDAGTCNSCGRTIEEIAIWPTASQAMKKEIVKASKIRKNQKNGTE